MGKIVLKVIFITFLFIHFMCLSSEVIAVEYNFLQERLDRSNFENTQEIEDIFRYNLSFLGENVSYAKVPRGFIISINSDVFFDDNKVELSEYSKQVLVIIGELLNIIDKQCVVEGNTLLLNTDETIYNSHWEISTARADRILKYLVREINVPPYRIRSIGFGDKIPFYKDIIDNPQMLQRVDFVVLNYEKFRQ